MTKICPNCLSDMIAESVGWKCLNCHGFLDMQSIFHEHKEKPFMPPMTNADRILATDDELAVMLHAVKLGYAPWCDYHCENEGDDGCDNCIKEWLQRTAEGE